MIHYHFIGIGGIGMSALAAMCRDLGCRVTGSDRGADRPENQRILGALRAQGITIYPQDGSFMADGRPDFLVYSTAIEEDNADFLAGKEVARLHRAELLEKVMLENRFGTTVAVTGSCGKSSVTAYLAETLVHLQQDPICLNGALVKDFMAPDRAGNYRSGKREYFVFEADESDKSLLRYGADCAIILNIGTDHYDKAELARVFAAFLDQVRRVAVVSSEVYEAVKPLVKTPPRFVVFGDNPSKSDFVLTKYAAQHGVTTARFQGERTLQLPQFGCHTALNALAIDALLETLGFEKKAVLNALSRFGGVWRRSDLAGRTAAGAQVFDDYAHNPEKIASCLSGVREIAEKRVFGVFQPHGFKPFGFMRDALFETLEKILREGDRFILLPPYYAGGTSSFSPTAEEVCLDWQKRSRHPERYLHFKERETLAKYLKSEAAAGDVVAVMGARDNSLSDFAKSLTL